MSEKDLEMGNKISPVEAKEISGDLEVEGSPTDSQKIALKTYDKLLDLRQVRKSSKIVPQEARSNLADLQPLA